MGSTRLTYQKDRNFCQKLLYFFENFVLVEEPRRLRIDLMYQPPKCPYSYFSKALEYYLGMLFPCEYR